MISRREVRPHLRTDCPTIGGRCLTVVIMLIITVIVIIRIRAGSLYVVQYHAYYSSADILQKAASPGDNFARSFAAVDDEQHAVDHACNQDSISKRRNWRRIHNNVREVPRHSLDESCHLFRTNQFGWIRRRGAGSKNE